MKRRHGLMDSSVLMLALLAVGASAAASAAEPATVVDVAAIDHALDRAVRFVVDHQSADGAWRASRYPALADGSSLTPLVLRALRDQRPLGMVGSGWQRGIDYLAHVRPRRGTAASPAESLKYPLYTAAGAVLALADTPASRDLRREWIEFIAARQLAEPLGWQTGDGEYGGWGYAGDLPLKPADGALRSPLEVANLSATVFAIEALRNAGPPVDDPSIARALRFVVRCQNYSTKEPREPRFDDGGFYFVLDDATRNKAGSAGTDATGRIRFRSYASTTADGLRAMRLCGLAPDDPRVAAARGWLKRSLDELKAAPGGSADTGSWRTASFYYACWSLSLSLDAFASDETARATLASVLLARQQADGSWSNPAIDLREDECLVATPLAIEALEQCRRHRAGRHDLRVGK